MGNKQTKSGNNFFNEIKEANSYRDFAIKMNKLISRGKIEGSIDTSAITGEELNIYEQHIRNFYYFVADHLVENSMKKEINEKKSYIMLRNLFTILSKLSIHMVNNKPLEFYNILWNRNNFEMQVEVKKDQGDNIMSAKVGEEEYDGSEYQMTVGIKLLVSALRLCFANGYGVKYLVSDKIDVKEEIAKHGWAKSVQSNTITQNRIALLEFLITFIFIEKKFMYIFNKFNNSVVSLIQKHNRSDLLFKSLLLTGVLYNENGVIPYSGYFYKNYLELNLYESALCLNMCLFLLKEPLQGELDEWENETKNQQVMLIKRFLVKQN